MYNHRNAEIWWLWSGCYEYAIQCWSRLKYWKKGERLSLCHCAEERLKEIVTVIGKEVYEVWMVGKGDDVWIKFLHKMVVIKFLEKDLKLFSLS